MLSDPETALEACVYLDEDYGSLDDEELAASSPSPLQDWLDDVIERPAPQYSVVHQSLAPSDLLPPAPHAGLLVPPAELREVETRWREVFTLAKPVSIHDTPQSAADPWEGNKCSRWLAFLDEHPDAFDSLDILDDLATALTMHPDSDLDDYQDDLHGILARARNITLATQSRSPQTHLYWVTTENRPALRALFRLHSLSEIDGDEELAMDCANELLALNPHDNHGLRCWLINQHLMRSEDAQALVIAERFPGDLFAETSYGRVLALHRLGRVDEARAALAAAYEVLPKIPQYLIAEEVEEPEIYDYGMRPGGDDQAWLYREEMRAVWLGAPGAIDLLRSATEM